MIGRSDRTRFENIVLALDKQCVRMHQSRLVLMWEMSCPHNMFEKIFVIFDAFKKVQAHIPSVFLLFIGENFWDQLGTNFLHAQFEGKNFVDGLAIQIQHTTDHSDC